MSCKPLSIEKLVEDSKVLEIITKTYKKRSLSGASNPPTKFRKTEITTTPSNISVNMNLRPPLETIATKSGQYYQKEGLERNKFATDIKHKADAIKDPKEKLELYMEATLNYLLSLHYREVVIVYLYWNYSK